MKKLLLVVLIFLLSMGSPISAKTRLIVLPPDFSGSRDALLAGLRQSILAVRGPDHVLFYKARPVTLLADIAEPTGPNAANRAWVKRKLGEQAAPVLAYLASLPSVSFNEPPSNVMIPNLVDELGRNVLSEQRGAPTDLLIIGSLINFDIRDDRWSMTDRFVPSEGYLQADPTKTPYGLSGLRQRLIGTTIHYCSPDGSAQFVSQEHEAAVKRWWSLWTTAQSGQVGTFSDDLGTCFRRFIASDASGQPVYTAAKNAKPEMIRVRLPIPSTLPQSMAQPGPYFLRDDVSISNVPPVTTTGIAWVGAKWMADCDLDVYARPDANSPWLFFGNVRTDHGFFNKDWREATANGQFEFVEFTKPIDLNTMQLAINLYAGSLPTGPDGKVRIWFDGKVYEAPFKLNARTGNQGRRPMTGPAWVQIDVRQVVGLSLPAGSVAGAAPPRTAGRAKIAE